MRYAMAALLALVIGTQADAQLIRRYNRVGAVPSSTYYYNSTPSYYSNGGIVSSSYYSPYSYSNSYVTPAAGYYTTPSVGFGFSNYGFNNYGGYSNYGYSNRGYYGGYRRGGRW